MTSGKAVWNRVRRSAGRFAKPIPIMVLALGAAQLSRSQDASLQAAAQTKLRATSQYGRLPLSFERNQGQSDPAIQFLAHGTNYAIGLTRDGALISVRKQAGATPENASPDIHFVGANLNPQISAEDELPGKVNYFIGNDRSKWRTNVPTFAKVLYKDVYPGIDVVYYGAQGELEFDFVVHPGANPDLIQVENLGGQKPSRNEEGDLVFAFNGGSVVLRKPVTFQTEPDGRKELASNYVLRDDGRIAFQVSNYDRRQPLVIDPQLVYATYVGGAQGTEVAAIAVDAAGEAYIVGTSATSYPVTSGSYLTTPPTLGQPQVIAKFNAAGSALEWATYFGGTGTKAGYSADTISAIALDAKGDAFITGQVSSLNLPVTPSAYLGTTPCAAANQVPLNPEIPNGNYCKNTAAFLSEISADGNSLLYSSYLGGSTAAFVVLPGPDNLELTATPPPNTGAVTGDWGTAIAVDSSGLAYVTGVTSSSDFPTTTGAFQTALNGRGSAFVAKFNPQSSGASSLVYSTYLAGNEPTQGTGIAADASGAAYVTGYTDSKLGFPTTTGAAFAGGSVGISGFVTKMNSTGTALVYSTYLATSLTDVNLYAIAVDSSGSAYVTGTATQQTNSPFPVTPGAYQQSCGLIPETGITACSMDAFVTKFSPDGSTLVYSTLLGGDGEDVGLGIAVDSAGHAIVTGATLPEFGPTDTFPTTTGAYQTSCSTLITSEGLAECNYQGFVTELSADGSSLVYSTFFGANSGGLQPTGVALDSQANIYIAGYIDSPNLVTTPGAYSSAFGPASGGFLAKFGTATVTPITVTTILPATAFDFPYSETLTASGGSGTYTWAVSSGTPPPGLSLSGGQLTGTVSASGTFSFGVTATDQNGNTGSATLTLVVSPGTSMLLSAPPCSPSNPANSTVNFGNVTVGSTANQSLCVTNTGSNTLYLWGIPGFLEPAYSVSGDTCNILVSTPPSSTNGVAPGQSCEITFAFDALGAATYTSGLTVFPNGPQQVVSTTGTGVNPSADLSISSLTNPTSVTAGTAFTSTVIVKNAGPNTATSITLNVGFSAPADFEFSNPQSGCSTTSSGVQCTLASLAPSTTQTFSFTVTPTTAGPFTESASVAGTPTDPNTANNSASATVTVAAASGGSTGSTGTCGCMKTGAYVNPALGTSQIVSATSDTLTTSDGAYTLTLTSSSLIIVNNSSKKTVLDQAAQPVGTTFAFGPSSNVFLIISGSTNSSSVTLYNLAGSSPNAPVTTISVGSSSIGTSFSPSGQFLVVTYVTGSLVTVSIYNTSTGAQIDSNSFTPAAGGPTSTGTSTNGIVNYGFSPEKPEGTFVYGFAVNANTIQLNAVNLTKTSSSSSRTLSSITSAFWQFSPCGDLLAIAEQTTGSQEQVGLAPSSNLNNNDGSTQTLPIGAVTFNSEGTNQQATVGSSQPVTLYTYPSCSGASPPPPPPTTPVTGTSLASSQSAITTDSSGNFILTVYVTNDGTVSSTSTSVASASITALVGGKAQTTAASTSLPFSLGTIATGQVVVVNLTFPASAGNPGSAAVKIGFTYSGGSASDTLKVTLP